MLKISEYVQGALADNLENLTVNVSPVPFNNRLEKSRSGDFDIVVGGWTPVYADPIDFLNLLQSKIPIILVNGLIRPLISCFKKQT